MRNDNVPGAGRGYEEFLTGLARASGIDTPTREDPAKADKERKNKGSNDDWHNPHDPDAKITRMKDGTTHPAHKQEHAVDMGEGSAGAAPAVTVQAADAGVTTTYRNTLEETFTNVNQLRDDPITAPRVNARGVEEVVEDKGHHSNQTMVDLKDIGVRSHVAESGRPEGRRRDREDKEEERAAVYANRRRVKGRRGRRLRSKRGELIERAVAHEPETDAMRRTHLRGHRNIRRRLLVHVAGFNPSLVMRQVLGRGTPRSFQGLGAALRAALAVAWVLVVGLGKLGRLPTPAQRSDHDHSPSPAAA